MSDDLDGELVDLRSRMSRALVDSHHALAAWTRRQAEDLAGLGIQPRSLEMDAFVTLDCQVALVRFLELRRGDTDEPAEGGFRRPPGLPISL
jgi:hypothetical protein